jgi:cysteine-rich repeat protein
MNRSSITLVAALVVACSAPAGAVEVVNCRIPDPGYPRFQALCEALRIEERQLPADWGEVKCASEFMRRGKRRFAVSRAEWTAKYTVQDAKRDEENNHDANHGKAFVRTWCGDGIEQLEFGEECDDGNDIETDGCNSSCEIVP